MHSKNTGNIVFLSSSLVLYEQHVQGLVQGTNMAITRPCPVGLNSTVAKAPPSTESRC